jgi:flagellar assembly protein FliH
MKNLQDYIKGNIEDYVFPSLDNKFGDEDESVVKLFEFKDIDKAKLPEVSKHEQVINLERNAAKKEGFDISPIVRQHRGINRQEELEYERRVTDEVERRLLKVEEHSFQKGYQEGLEQGKKEVFEQTRVACEEKLEALGELINEVLEVKQELIAKEKLNLYSLIRNLVKWVTLRELKDDGAYITRLLEKLINELGTKSNILIQIDKKSFEEMPEILDHVQTTLGKLEKVRLEVDYDLNGPGIVLESENGIINGTLIEQFKGLDRLFKGVGLVVESDFPAKEYFSENEITDKELEVKEEGDGEDNDE